MLLLALVLLYVEINWIAKGKGRWAQRRVCLKAAALSEKYGFPIFECSAKTGENVLEVFQEMGKFIIKNAKPPN